MNHFTSRDSRGLPLIELLIVITGILAAIAMPVLLDLRETAEDSAANGGMHNVELGVAGGTGLTFAGHKSDDDLVVPSTGVTS